MNYMLTKRTKIVCTIGPACDSVKILKEMIHAGMNVARLNFSHGTYDTHLNLIKNIRQAAKETRTIITIVQDLQGPRIRLAKLPAEGVMIKKGDKVVFTTGKPVAGKIGVTYRQLNKEIKANQRILIADGVFEFLVTQVKGQDIICLAVTDAKLTSNKGMNFPDTTLKISSVSDKDAQDLVFGISQDVDFVALSFVRTASDVLGLRKRIAKLEGHPNILETITKIIVKIEMPDAIRNFEEILTATDVVMVARGDLGVELPPEEVPLLQKKMIARCNEVAKPVIVATQMLESMMVNPRPTRAEVSDVANAVIDQTDAVMLSGETAGGKYPVEAVRMMSNILNQVEKSQYDNLDYSHAAWHHLRNEEGIASAAVILSTNVHVKMIMVLSRTGGTARLVSKYRPHLPIMVTSSSATLTRQLNMSWGIVPLPIMKNYKDDAIIKQAITYGKQRKLISAGDRIILIKGHRQPAKRHQLKSIDLITLQ